MPKIEIDYFVKKIFCCLNLNRPIVIFTFTTLMTLFFEIIGKFNYEDKKIDNLFFNLKVIILIILGV